MQADPQLPKAPLCINTPTLTAAKGLPPYRVQPFPGISKYSQILKILRILELKEVAKSSLGKVLTPHFMAWETKVILPEIFQLCIEPLLFKVRLACLSSQLF